MNVVSKVIRVPSIYMFISYWPDTKSYSIETWVSDALLGWSCSHPGGGSSSSSGCDCQWAQPKQARGIIQWRQLSRGFSRVESLEISHLGFHKHFACGSPSTVGGVQKIWSYCALAHQHWKWLLKSTLNNCCPKAATNYIHNIYHNISASSSELCWDIDLQCFWVEIGHNWTVHKCKVLFLLQFCREQMPADTLEKRIHINTKIKY